MREQINVKEKKLKENKRKQKINALPLEHYTTIFIILMQLPHKCKLYL